MATNPTSTKKPVDTKSGKKTSATEKKVSKASLEDKDESVKKHRANSTKKTGL